MGQHDAAAPQGAAGSAEVGTAIARLVLRPITPEDEPFLYAVYASTRAEEMALVDWDEGQKAAFVQMQFTAQDRYYHEHYADAAFQVILCDGVPAGRLYVDRSPAEITIVDI